MVKRTFKTESAMRAFVQEQSAKGKVWHVMVLHDDGCSPSRCTCKPWYEVQPMTSEAYQEGAAKQAEWVKKSSS